MKSDRFVIQNKTHTEFGVAYLNSPCGTLKIWCDEDGMYIDLADRQQGDICLISMHPDSDGMEAYIYGDPKSGKESVSYKFYDVTKEDDEY